MHAKYKGCPHISDAEYLAKLKAKCTITESGCWDFNGFVHPSRGMEHRGPRWGYGTMSYRGNAMRTHKIAYTVTRGPIPKGMYVMHTCDLPRCCNPDHVKLGTPGDNSRDAAAKGRSDRQWQTHCGRGHEFTAENTLFRDNKRKRGRLCKICNRMRFRLKARGQRMEPIPRARPAM
jgi:hypothetical protein